MFLRIRGTTFGVFALIASLFAVPANAQGFGPSSMGSWPSTPGYSHWLYNYLLLNRYPDYLRYGGNPATGYWATSPQSFLYQRPGFAEGPYGYIQGWVSPQGDFEGTMVVRGNMRKLMSNYYRNWLYNYYLNNYWE